MTPTDQERKNALEWLENWRPGSPTLAKHAQTILAMLAEPRLPEEPTPDALKVMSDQISNYTPAQSAYQVYRALYAHLTKPKTKTVQVWRIEFTGRNGLPYIDQGCSHDEATYRAHVLIGEGAKLVRITGPHEQDVPA